MSLLMRFLGCLGLGCLLLVRVCTAQEASTAPPLPTPIDNWKYKAQLAERVQAFTTDLCADILRQATEWQEQLQTVQRANDQLKAENAKLKAHAHDKAAPPAQ